MSAVASSVADRLQLEDRGSNGSPPGFKGLYLHVKREDDGDPVQKRPDVLTREKVMEVAESVFGKGRVEQGFAFGTYIFIHVPIDTAGPRIAMCQKALRDLVS